MEGRPPGRGGGLTFEARAKRARRRTDRLGWTARWGWTAREPGRAAAPRPPAPAPRGGATYRSESAGAVRRTQPGRPVPAGAGGAELLDAAVAVAAARHVE